jgi:hypothetical protein
MLHIETSSICNLNCRFCAYGKKQSPKVTMSNEFFASCVEQAVSLGYTGFELTPCTGDVFMDRRIFDKFAIMDARDDISGYGFYTNFSVLDEAGVAALMQLKKLRYLIISVYGHDLGSFIAITRSTEKVYQRFLKNLETLRGLLGTGGVQVSLGLRTKGDAPETSQSPVMNLIAQFQEAGCSLQRSRIFSNWGGYITNKDVAGLSIDVTTPGTTYKNGACALLFTDLQIMATGIVNGCACRDVDATLRIGDLNTQPLHEIISPENPAYVALIEEQQAGQFREVCKSCDFYQSIYHMRSKNRAGTSQCTIISGYMENRRAKAAAVAV